MHRLGSDTKDNSVEAMRTGLVTVCTCKEPNYDLYSKVTDCKGENTGGGATMEAKAMSLRILYMMIN